MSTFNSHLMRSNTMKVTFSCRWKTSESRERNTPWTQRAKVSFVRGFCEPTLPMFVSVGHGNAFVFQFDGPSAVTVCKRNVFLRACMQQQTYHACCNHTRLASLKQQALPLHAYLFKSTLLTTREAYYELEYGHTESNAWTCSCFPSFR